MKPEFYDSYWRSGLHAGGEWSHEEFGKVMGLLKGRKRVLDYGCGLGYSYQRLLTGYVDEYVGADVSEFALQDLNAKGLAGLSIGPQSRIMAEADSFDGATCIEVFEHLFDPLEAACEIYRVLQPGGVLVASVPNFGYHPWRLQALIRARVPSEPENPKKNFFNGVHIRYFNTSTFRRLLHDAGFSNISVYSFDNSSIWDVFLAFSYLGLISNWARKHLPSVLHLRFLQKLMPCLFAYRIRAVAWKK